MVVERIASIRLR